MYVLDTDIVTYALRRPQDFPHLIDRLEAVPSRLQFISIVTATELIKGWIDLLPKNANQPGKLLKNYENLYQTILDLRQYQILRFDGDAYGYFRRMGRVQVSRNDKQIAATALANRCHVVTNNHTHFNLIKEACPELEIDDWISAPLEEGH